MALGCSFGTASGTATATASPIHSRSEIEEIAVRFTRDLEGERMHYPPACFSPPENTKRDWRNQPGSKGMRPDRTRWSREGSRTSHWKEQEDIQTSESRRSRREQKQESKTHLHGPEHAGETSPEEFPKVPAGHGTGAEDRTGQYDPWLHTENIQETAWLSRRNATAPSEFFLTGT